MKRYILAVMGSLLLNLMFITFISMHWVDATRLTPSVELVFDDSEGSLFHDEIGSYGLEDGGTGSSQSGKDGGPTSSGLSGSPEKSFKDQKERKPVIQSAASGTVDHDSHESKKIEEPSTKAEMNSLSKSSLGSDEKSLPSGQTALNGEKEPGKAESTKTVSTESNGGQENPNSNPAGTGHGKPYGIGEKGRGTGEGPGKSENASYGSGTGNGSGATSSVDDSGTGGSGKVAPVLIKEAYPEYPEEARDKGWEGRVYLKLTIDLKGRVVNVKILESSGYEVLDKEAIKAAKRLRYKPATRNGTLVEWYLNKAFIFKLQ